MLVNINCDKAQRENFGYAAIYWFRDPGVERDQYKEGKATGGKVRPGGRALKYKSFLLNTTQIVGIAERFDGKLSVKLTNGDCLVFDCEMSTLKKLLKSK